MEKNDRSLEIVKNIIPRVFSFLESEYFYIPVWQKKESAVFLECLEVEYTNEKSKRQVRISYVKGNVYDQHKYTFNVSITRIPYVRVEDFFSLSSYLQSKGKDFSTSLVDRFDEAEAEMLLNKIAIALKQCASEIIDGSLWLEEFYPRKD